MHLFQVRIEQLAQIAAGTTLFVLGSTDSQPLPDFEAGSHITVVTPSGMRRQYSLCGYPQGTGRWEIAVKREGRGRGGSVSLVDWAKVGYELAVSVPENKFSLEPTAKQYLFIAGGIGITPILSMVRALVAEPDAEVSRIKLVYLTRDLQSTAFASELQALVPPKSLVIHHDQGQASKQFDLWALLEKPNAQYVYCCGPTALMDSVRDMTGHWPQKQIKFESFGTNTVHKLSDDAFQVQIASTGDKFSIEPGVTILDTLRANGIAMNSSCESGTCGTCKTGLIEGTPDHRDAVLLDDEKQFFVMPCVSRAVSDILILDL